MNIFDFPTEIPDSFSNKMDIHPVHFAITKKLLERFSEITGDKSLLHVSEDFARRSIYRQQVAHGMLPVAFISLLDIFHLKGYACIVHQLKCQFVEPVFIGDELTLHGRLAETDEETNLIRVAFTVTKRMSGIEAVNGSIQVCFAHQSPGFIFPESVDDRDGLSCKGVGSPKVMELLLEDIIVDDTDGFPFDFSRQTLIDFQKITAKGVLTEDQHKTEVAEHTFYLPDLFAIMLFSTSVGVCIPGKYATFLAFEANVHRHLTIDTPYFLHGKISHISKATRIIKKNITITDKDSLQERPLVTGNVHILVNEPPVTMPKINELRKTSLDYGLNGKVALITGASGGIGETIAKFLSLYGVKAVVNFFRGKNDALRVVEEINSENGQAIAVQADVTSSGQVTEMVNEVVAQFGAIDILVNNAVGDFKPIPFSRLIWEDIQKDIDIVVKGAFNCCKEVLPHMLKKGRGKIINIGTVATNAPPANQVKYVISKSGLVGLTRSLSVEFAAKNIQVNMVVPSFVETDLVSHIPGVYREKIAKDTPMGRNASPADVAQAVLFLASSYSSFTTGQKILVTGGGTPYT